MLAIYDAKGKIITLKNDGEYEPVGVPLIKYEEREGYTIDSIDVNVTPHEPVWNKVPDLPKTLQEVVQEMQENQNAIMLALAESLGV